MLVKLNVWAEQAGFNPESVRAWARAGKMPVPTIKTPTGQWMVEVDDTAGPAPSVGTGRTVVYARVSSSDQKADLDSQVVRVMQSYGKPVDEVVTEVGSGMNPGRKKLNRILADRSVTTIVVEHRDRLARMNFELLESSMAAAGRKIVVLNDDELDDDLVRDITEFMTSVCARLYGRRGAKNRAERAITALKPDTVREG